MAAAKTVLDTFLDFLDYSSDNEKEETIETPHIDKVLQQYHNHLGKKGSPSKTNEQKRGVSVSLYPSNSEYDIRLGALERQLTELMQKNEGVVESTSSKKPNKTKRKVIVSDSESSPSHHENIERNKGKTKKMTKPSVSSVTEDKKTKCQLYTTPTDHTHSHIRPEPLQTKRGTRREVDEERERRWKAEQAAVRLAEHVRNLQLQVEEWQKKLEVSVSRGNQLETALIKEKEKIARLNEEKENFQSVQSDKQNEIERLQKRCEDQNKQLRNLEEQTDKLEKARSQVYNDMSEKLREVEVRAGASDREVALQHQVVRKLQQQLQELQELLATREQEHHKELDRLKPPDSRDVREIVEKEIERERMRLETIVVQYKERLDQQQKSYHDLEEEFRTALRIEAARYQQLESIHDKLTDDLTTCQEELTILRDKETKATKLISELSTIVKEQKSRITELTTNQQQLLSQYREKTRQLDTEMTTRSKLESRVSTLQEDNAGLLAKLSAQESLIKGLREERKLWSQELASQGASLAQDRGKLESQIESLMREVSELQDLYQTSKTTVRVREKVIEDQTSTIKQLKEEISTLKVELSSNQSDWLNKLDVLHNDLEQEQSCRQDLNEQLDIITEQKMKCEQQIYESKENEKKWKEKYSKLKGQWEERVGLIASLENSVHQLQEKAKQREQDLIKERDQSILESKQSLEQLQQVKISLNNHLINQQKLIEERVSQALRDKDIEILEAHRKVATVEEEMRQVLTETAKERKAMEAKFQRLSKTFHDLQKELT